jgi:hypothetical protein
MATIVDEDGDIIHTYDPIEYEVRGADDEITLSLDDPDFYVFTIHSTDIGENPTLDADNNLLIGGKATIIYLGLDLDNNANTGRTHFDIGDEFLISTWHNGHTWEWDEENSRWVGSNQNVELVLESNSVTFRVPRDRITALSEDGTINTSGVFNDAENNGRHHYAWPNIYEFELN